MREGDAGVTRGEVRYLLPPRQMISAQAVRKDDRRPFAGHLVMDFRVAPAELASGLLHLSNALRVQCFAFTAPLGALPFAIAPACATVSID